MTLQVKQDLPRSPAETLNFMRYLDTTFRSWRVSRILHLLNVDRNVNKNDPKLLWMCLSSWKYLARKFGDARKPGQNTGSIWANIPETWMTWGHFWEDSLAETTFWGDLG